MFTSRAEYRLTLRADNADQRLTDLGINLDLIGFERKKIFSEKKKNIFSLNNFLETKFLTPNEAKKHDIKIAMDGVKRSCLEVMGQRKVDMAKIRQIFSDIPVFSDLIEKQVVVDAHYMGYLKRQERDIKSFKKDESVIIPKNINYENLSGLSNEVKSKLISIRPKTLGQAIRIDGVTPAAVIILLSHIKKLKFKATA
jgi:tRNA uridine 5-carboxymethylaminomethyl modification enzyme